MYKLLAQLNKILLPSYSKRQLDLTKANKIQLAIIAWRYHVTKKVINQ